MQTPWFLDHLGLDAETDLAAVKRAYAQRLKQIDQATDIDGFMRLREAYAAATAWCRRTADVPVTVAPEQARAAETPEAVPATEHAPAIPTPMDAATQALQDLAHRLGNGEAPAAALPASLQRLSGEHLHATAISEAMLIDQLASAHLPQRLALFGVAHERMGWGDITRLRQLGGRGQWIRAVLEQEALWKRTSEAMGCHDLFDRLGGAPALDRTDLSPAQFGRDAVLRWPDMQDLLRRYPQYLVLRVERSALDAWKQAFEALPLRDKTMAESFSNLNLPSPAAYRRAAPPRQREHNGGRIGLVIAAVVVFNMISHLLGSGSTPTPAPVVAPAPLVSRVPLVLPEHVLANPANCGRIERVVHEADWAPPLDPTQLHRLRDAVSSCLTTRQWPHWRMADPQLARLGIQT
ncbi:hypothetical protein SAMN04487785_10696 [Dyella jiangningensis]|uniref:hypothetical protein n=1 Tax=Dyella sp. AtDHG13 TaxID=1938897 RepID=UPI000882CD45|nr:hypothetical protein [Dyella sp. AtDHG13]PXV59176.1 hypothetical protein BDW41_104221 [Dyella sp. AtDHG13]SDK24913.1 hypothetical protein SAMN04487785_10696 [Dyella jiangningensis]